MLSRSLCLTVLTTITFLSAGSEAEACFGKRCCRQRTSYSAPVPWSSVPVASYTATRSVYGTKATTNAIVYCTGTCKDGTSVGANGFGSTYAEAQTDANNKIVLQCVNRGGIKSYDTCIPYDSASNKSGFATSTHYFCLNVEGGREPGVHYYSTYQDAYNSRAYFFTTAVGARSVSGPYDCYYP